MPTLDEIRAAGEARLSAFRLSVDDVTQADIQVIADFLNYFDTRQKQDEEDAAYLRDLRARRARAGHGAASPDAKKDAEAEATTAEDIDRLTAMARARGEVVEALARTRSRVWVDFMTDRRCPVCGNTSAQSAAQNYDCTNEC